MHGIYMYMNIFNKLVEMNYKSDYALLSLRKHQEMSVKFSIVLDHVTALLG
jgi:hypothetical protein